MKLLRCLGLTAPLLALAAVGPAAADSADAGAGADGNALEEVTVTATRTERASFTTPSAVSVVDAAEAALFQPNGFADVLEGVPGTSIVGGSRRVAEEPSIRGFVDEQVIMRLDGARQNFDLAHRGRFFVDPLLLERAEVVRGGASALYGSGALGGVISLDTLGARDLLAEGRRFGAIADVGYLSNGAEPVLALRGFGAGEKLDALVSATYRSITEDLNDGDGEDILDTRDRVTSVLGKVGFEPGSDQRLELTADFYESDGENPTNATSVSAPSTVVDRDTRRRSARARYSLAPADRPWIDFNAVAWTASLDSTESRFIDGRLDESSFDSVGVDLYNTSRFAQGGHTSFALTYGAEAFRDRQSGTRDGEERTQFPRAERSFAAAYLQLEIDIGQRFSIIPGLRYDRFSLEADDEVADRDEDQLTPRLAVGYSPTDWLYLWSSYAEGFRAPSLTQLYNRGVHFAVPNGVGPDTLVVNEFVPTPDLEPETTETYEAGLRLRFEDLIAARDRLSFAATAFRSDIENYIDQTVVFLDPTRPPVFTPPAGPLTFFGATVNDNVEAELQGVEAELRYRRGGLSGFVTATLLDGERRDTGEPLGSVPQDRVTAQLSGRLPGNHIEIGGRATWADDRTDVPADTLPGESFTTVDVFLAWRPRWRPLADTSVVFGVDNLLDETYAVYPTVINQPGRSFRVSISQRIDR